MKIDAFDKHILRLTQQNNRLTADEIGKEVGLSSSAVQRRMKRMREEKIITADISIINPSALGLEIMCVVDVALESGTQRSLEKFKTTMLKCKDVTQCYYVTGTYDFVLVVQTASMEQYETFTNKWLLQSSDVKHFYTHVVMDKVKVRFGIAV